ncbi:MAG: WD40 repeat domain-containing protein, partial [Trebonia sp.]
LRTLRQLRISVEGLSSVAFSPDGTRIAYGSGYGPAGVVSLTGDTIVSYAGPTSDIGQVAFSASGRLVATASQDGTTRIWQTSGQAISTGPAVPVQFSFPPAQPIAGGFVIPTVTNTGSVVLERWSDAGRPVGRPLELASTCEGCGAFVTPDGRLAGLSPASGADTRVRIWNVAERRLVAVLPPTPSPQGYFPVISPNGQTIAETVGNGSGGLELAIVDVRTGRWQALLPTSCASGFQIAFSPSGRRLAAGSFCGSPVAVWNLGTGRRTELPAIDGNIAAVAFSPDGRQIAVASLNDTVTIDSVSTGRTLAALIGHTGAVSDVTYSPNGRYIASASADHTVRIWDAHTFALLRDLRGPDGVTGVRFTPDGQDVLTYDEAGVFRLWDACTDCENPGALLALGRARVTRALTPQERRTFGVG